MRRSRSHLEDAERADVGRARASAPTTWALADILRAAHELEPGPRLASVLIFVASAGWDGQEVEREDAERVLDWYVWPVALREEARCDYQTRS